MQEAPDRQWETAIEVAQPTDGGGSSVLAQVMLYGASVKQLQAAAAAYLDVHRPKRFGNRGDHISGKIAFISADGKSETVLRPRPQVLQEGWWRVAETMKAGQIDQYARPELRQLPDFDAAVTEFVTGALIPLKGPDYHPGALLGGELQLHHLAVTLREIDVQRVNDLLARGWLVFGMEYKGHVDEADLLVKRLAIFLLGHADLLAASYTLDSGFYQQWQKFVADRLQS